MKDTDRQAALDYHAYPHPGKISVTATKPLVTQRDLSLAYSPGVAAACEEIVEDPANVFRYTGRGNLVGVITNGTAVLGLGNIGALASKPVMEGKAVLFKKFAGLDVFDIEINETDPDKLVEIIAGLEATFGGINLEDIKAPECFTVERKLRERMKIPVFHDDQHGTAITVCAAVVNGLAVAGKRIEDVKLVTSGAGAAALACLDLLVDLGLPLEHIWVTDIEGVVYEGRKKLMDADKERFARKTKARTLAEVIEGADVFLGLSAGNVLKPEMVATMAANPLILALANPNPEILPEAAHAVRDDIIMATGRSDYPNQVNNVLCFPYIFRGALDVGATTITREMEKAAVLAIANLAREEQNEVVAAAYGTYDISFGRDYLPDSQAVRPASDRAHRAGGRQGGHGGRRGHASHRRPGRLRRAAAAVRLPLRRLHEAAVLAGQADRARRRAGAHRVHRGRGRARAARRAGHRRRESRQAHPGGPPPGAAVAHREIRPAPAPGPGRRGLQPGIRRALPPVLDHLLGHDVPQRHHQGDGARGNAPPPDPDRRHDGAPGRRRRHDLRRGQRLPRPPALHRPGHRQEARRHHLRGDEHPAAGRAHRGPGGHARQ
ncbi:malic enzyme, NAD-binding domain protein [Bordetella bronchiseptica E014]|nr:malic enzyme, NAD-binding domain protein [Bordetella bronchiseptica E014]